LNFIDIFSKNTQIKNFTKIRALEAELFQADRQTDRQTERKTDMAKLTVAFRNFAYALKNQCKRQ